MTNETQLVPGLNIYVKKTKNGPILGPAMHTCMDCVRKHLGTAMEFSNEAFDGYFWHETFAFGQLYHAQYECRFEHPEFSRLIRKYRTWAGINAEMQACIPYEALIIIAYFCAGEEDKADRYMESRGLRNKFVDIVEICQTIGASIPECQLWLRKHPEYLEK